MKTINEMFQDRVQILLPGLKILRKKDSAWYRFLGKIIKPIVPDYLDRYPSAALDGNIYLDEESWNKPNISVLPTLAHEAFHLYERKKSGMLSYMLAYLFPQTLAMLSLLAFVNLWFLIALVFLAPIPAPFRASMERDGYRIQLFTLSKLRPGVDLSDYVRGITDFFFSWSYYKMWPFDRGSQEVDFMLWKPDMSHPMYRFIIEFIDEVKR